MKKSVILLALVIIAAFSCKKDYKFYAFYLDKEVEIEYPASINDEEVTVISETVDLYIDKIYTQEETSADLVEEITLENISFLTNYYRTFNVYIGTEDGTEILVAEKTDNSLIETKIDIKDIVNASKIYIKTAGVAYGTSEASTIKYKLSFFIKTYVK